jgi:DNA-binding NtrC family response regulator
MPPRKYGLLVVDDEDGVRGVLNVGMQHHGFAVWLAADGQEALDLYRRHRETIDVVLLDVRMPGLDGPRTLAALQELNPRVRCCFMSGNPGTCTEEGLRRLGAATVLPKPFRLDDVALVLLGVAQDANGESDMRVNSYQTTTG